MGATGRAGLGNALFPVEHCLACTLCEGAQAGFCAACRAYLYHMCLPPTPIYIPQPWPAFDAAYGAYAYAGCARKAVHALKFGGQPHRAASFLREGIVRLAAQCLPPGAVVVPLPLSRERMMQRGYNQSRILAGMVVQAQGRPVQEDVVWRTRATHRQAEVPLAERHDNVRGAFTACARAKGLCIALVDDVLTTGATASACATALKEQGARSVIVISATRAMDDYAIM